MRRTLSLLALGLTFWVLSGVATAAPITFTTTLRGTNEVPPNASAGIGVAVVTIDPVSHMLTVNVSFSGLTGLTTASHIHCCSAVGVNASVATTTPTFPNFPLNVTAGTYFNIFDMTQASTFNPAFVTAQGGLAAAEAAFIAGMQAGQTYFNIHTTIFPGGEIRGQLQAVPEPATLILLGIGLAGGAGKALRRRRGR